MASRAGIALAFATIALSVPAPVSAQAQPEGKVVVFVTEGSTISLAGTKLKQYDAATTCQAFPLGAHVVINQTNRRLLFYTDPTCLFPAPPPFNFIDPGYGTHVAPTGAFRSA